MYYNTVSIYTDIYIYLAFVISFLISLSIFSKWTKSFVWHQKRRSLIISTVLFALFICLFRGEKLLPIIVIKLLLSNNNNNNDLTQSSISSALFNYSVAIFCICILIIVCLRWNFLEQQIMQTKTHLEQFQNPKLPKLNPCLTKTRGLLFSIYITPNHNNRFLEALDIVR